MIWPFIRKLFLGPRNVLPACHGIDMKESLKRRRARGAHRSVSWRYLVFGLLVPVVSPTVHGAGNETALALMSVLAGSVGQVPFTEEAAKRGIDYITSQGYWSDGFGCGVAFVDLDGDGDADLILTGRSDGVVGVYENQDGYFIDRSSGSGIPPLTSGSGVTAGDYDGDGDLDLYLANWLMPNTLMRNDGDFQFTDVTASAGVGDAGQGIEGVFGDYDGDGWLDIYVSNYTYPNPDTNYNRLYHNLGDGTFEDVGETMGVDDHGLGFEALFFDYDRDGDDDLYLSNDRAHATGYGNRLWENVNGVFQDVSQSSGADAYMHSMGVGVGDFDGNGYPDLYCTNERAEDTGNRLFLNQGDGTFLDLSHEAGVAGEWADGYATGWGALFLDYDNDGVQDLYVVNSTAPNFLFEHGGAFPCADIAPLLGLDTGGQSFSTAMADVDADGDLDLLLQNHGEAIRLFINHEGEQRNWLKIKLFGAGPNTHAVGALVDVTTGSQTQYREVMTGIGYKSSSSLVLHFGLGTATTVDLVSILWPGGSQTFLVNVPVNQQLTVVEGALLPGDCDGDDDADLNDFSTFVNCAGGPGEPAPTGCQCADLDDDGDVDLRDFGFLQTTLTGP